MKKMIFKTITLSMFFGISLILYLLNGCQKNVSDVYGYDPVVLAPDFEIANVDYSFDTDELNSESWLSFKVSYKNGEQTEVTYPSVLNFYVDGLLQESILLNDISGNIIYDKIFNWRAKAGEHVFKFEINVSSDGSIFIDEANTANNTKSLDFEIPVKELEVVQEVVVDVATITDAITEDSESGVADVLASEGITVSSSVDVVKTTYDNNTIAVVAAVMSSDGSIDPTKVVLSVTSNPGATQGESLEAKITLVVETKVEEKKVSFYNAKGVLAYTDGVVSFVKSKSAKNFTPCTEPTDMEALFNDASALAAYIAALNSDQINGYENASQILINILTAYGYTQGSVDNPPIMRSEIINATEVCSTQCINKVKVNTFAYPGFKLTFTDDRNSGVVLAGTSNVISTYTKAPKCASSNDGTYTFEDCGGNAVSFTLSNSSRPVVTTNDKCGTGVHN